MKWKLTESGLDKFNPVDGAKPVITHHMCHSPKHYNIKVLPQYLKDQVAQHYQEHKDWVMTTDFSDKVKNNFVKVLTGIEKFMMSEVIILMALSLFIFLSGSSSSVEEFNKISVFILDLYFSAKARLI